ncbi:hypothetical protein [Maricaulis sp.]|uniref:hypothetical protein n=1 Tax=Maricaulis sp. TaxID=1486257 RepID=UPI002B26EDDB|nr:hypothetical protein [Maricaulis sp.]
MSLLPTAHAGQSFGARRIDFYTVSGEVSASDDATGRVTDTDSMTHDVRLLDRSNALAPGDTASVLRVQAGPNRRSRPVAIINHSRGTWMRAAPEATTLLARSGVTRGFNWWLSVLVLALVAIAAVWPAIHVFLTEVNANLMAPVPVFDVFTEINAALPALGGWRMEAALPSGLLDSLASLGFIPMDQLTQLSLALGAGLLTLLAFFGRSWRLVYIPALGALALAGGAILGSTLPTLAVIGGSLAFFVLGGLVNRIRDGGRFNARVARLAEHALRNPPQEGVRSGDTGSAAPAVAASAAIATATAAAQGDNPTGDMSEAANAEPASGAASEAASDTHASGEAEAPNPADLLPAAPDDTTTTDTVTAGRPAAPEAAGDAVAAAETDAGASDAESETETESVAADAQPTAPGTTADDASTVTDIEPSPEAAVIADAVIDETADRTDPIAATASDDAGNDDTADAIIDTEALTPEQPAGNAPDLSAADEDAVGDSEDTAIAADMADAPTTESAPAPVTGSDQVEADDDLPSLDEVAAAAALSETESAPANDAGSPASGAPSIAVDLNDERTMPVAPPPPMPGDGAPQVAAPANDSSELIAGPAEADSPDEIQPDDPATPAPELAAPIVDDPMMDEAGDPMVPAPDAGDLAPGAPDIELDRTPAE